MKKTVIVTALLFATTNVWSADKIKFSFQNEEVTKVLEVYSKASNERFVVSPAVRGKITLLNPTEITLEDAFNQLSAGLALNGFGVYKKGDAYVVENSRSVARSSIEVTNQLPTLNPERLVTWVITLKNVPATNINRELRTLVSRDGELNVSESSNQLIITDWTSSLQRVSEILKQIDKPVDAQTAKLIEAGRRGHAKNNKPAEAKEIKKTE